MAMDPLTAGMDLGGKLVDFFSRFVEDKTKVAELAAATRDKILDGTFKGDADQRDINKVEAASPSMFVAGWRPGAGWLCVGGMGWQFFVSPMLTWLIQVGCLLTGHDVAAVPPLPMLGDTTLTNLLYALLGLGTMRGVDKIAGVDQKAVGGLGAVGVGAMKAWARISK